MTRPAPFASPQNRRRPPRAIPRTSASTLHGSNDARFCAEAAPRAPRRARSRFSSLQKPDRARFSGEPVPGRPRSLRRRKPRRARGHASLLYRSRPGSLLRRTRARWLLCRSDGRLRGESSGTVSSDVARLPPHASALKRAGRGEAPPAAWAGGVGRRRRPAAWVIDRENAQPIRIVRSDQDAADEPLPSRTSDAISVGVTRRRTATGAAPTSR